MINDNDKELFYLKAKTFKEKQIIAHASLSNGQFYNGLIISVGDEFFEIEDKKFGLTVVFFLELKRLEEFRNV